MNATVLSFLVCLITSPEECKTVELKFDPKEVTIQICELHFQQVLAGWVGQNPKYKIMGKIVCKSSEDVDINI